MVEVGSNFNFGNNSIVRVKESVWPIVVFFWTWKVHKSQRQCQCTSYIWESCPSLLLPAWGEWQHVSIVQIWIFIIKKPSHGLVVTCFTCHLKKNNDDLMDVAKSKYLILRSSSECWRVLLGHCFPCLRRCFALLCFVFLCLNLHHSLLREQWIRAKYERMEFTGETKYPPIPYTTGDVISRVSLHWFPSQL